MAYEPLIGQARLAKRMRKEMQCDPQWVLDLAAERDQILVERDGANERAGLLLKAKDEWAERARAAEAELDQARRTAEHWKAEHLAGNAVIDQLRAEVERLTAAAEDEAVYGDHNLVPSLQAEVEALRGDLSAAASIANQNADHALRLNADVEALRHLAGELYQVLGALDAPAGVLDAVLAAAHGEPMEGRGSLLPFVSEEHEALRKDAERYRGVRRVAGAQGYAEDQFDEQTDQRVARFDAALAAKEGV